MKILRIAICLFLSTISALAEPVVTASPEGKVNEPVTIKVEGLAPNIGYWVTLIPRDAELGTWSQYHYFEHVTAGETTLKTENFGPHEIRLHDKRKPYALYARIPIEISLPGYTPPEILLPKEPVARRPLDVVLKNLQPSVRYWITLIPADAPVGTWAEYHYLEQVENSDVVFKPLPGGDYELRLHDRAAGFRLYAKKSITMPNHPDPVLSDGTPSDEPAAPGKAAVPKVAAQVTTNARTSSRAETGPCVNLVVSSAQAVAACMRHMQTTPAADVFAHNGATCIDMQFQLTLSQVNRSGTTSNHHYVERLLKSGVKVPDCRMIAEQVETEFGQAPPWAACLDSPQEVGPDDHVACIEGVASRVMLLPRFPTTCSEMTQWLRGAYSAALRNFSGFFGADTVFGHPFDCSPYQGYLAENQGRAVVTPLSKRYEHPDPKRDREMAQFVAAQRPNILQGLDEAQDRSFAQMRRQDVNRRLERPQSADDIADADVVWALIKLIHRLNPERGSLTHSTSGLFAQQGRGQGRTTLAYAVKKAKIVSCGPVRTKPVECEVELTVGARLSAPNNQGANLLLNLTDGGWETTETLQLNLDHDGTQWSLASISPKLLAVLFPTKPNVGTNNSFAFNGYSPEECVWLNSMGAGGAC